MKKLRVLQTTLLCVVAIGVCLACFGCADDNEQIRSVIHKSYQNNVRFYLEGTNSHLVMPGYGIDIECFFYSNTLETLQALNSLEHAREITLRFSDIEVKEDYATAHYLLTVIDEDGTRYSTLLVTYLVKDNGRWKLRSTNCDN